jgi:hypothetical protein
MPITGALVAVFARTGTAGEDAHAGLVIVLATERGVLPSKPNQTAATWPWPSSTRPAESERSSEPAGLLGADQSRPLTDVLD